MNVGVLALQGGFALHHERLAELGYRSSDVTTAAELARVDALILPGGESSVLLKLCDEDFRKEIVRRTVAGMPILATCAGLILVARSVDNPVQESLGLIDIDVTRNAYGRQKDSFISTDLRWTDAGIDLLSRIGHRTAPVEGVFIRAPQIRSLGEKVQVLLEHIPSEGPSQPVLVRQGNRFGATFHPELSPRALEIHDLFLKAPPGEH